MIARLSLRSRVALLTVLAERVMELSRTGLMALVYLLQTVKQVPFGYRFRFGLYGPYDPQVLTDVALAEAWGALEESFHTTLPNAYGFKIVATKNASDLLGKEREALDASHEAIEWVIQRFGNCNTQELMLCSVLVWIDRELAQLGEPYDLERITDIACRLVPCFSKEGIGDIALRLERAGALSSSAVDSIHENRENNGAVSGGCWTSGSFATRADGVDAPSACGPSENGC